MELLLLKPVITDVKPIYRQLWYVIGNSTMTVANYTSFLGVKYLVACAVTSGECQNYHFVSLIA